MKMYTAIRNNHHRKVTVYHTPKVFVLKLRLLSMTDYFITVNNILHVWLQTGLTGSVVQVITGIFCAAHPHDDLTKEMSARLCSCWMATIIPFDGFLRCGKDS